MKRIEYPQDSAFLQSYLDIFREKISEMQMGWTRLRDSSPSELGYLPSDITRILLASFEELVSWYIQFIQLPRHTRKILNDALLSVFNYDDWSSTIAEYYKDYKNGFHISTCHYCDMAYVNVYEVDPDSEALFFLNNASDEELDKLTKSSPKKEIIKAHRPFLSKADFDNLSSSLRWGPQKWEKTFKPDYRYRHHFDLDHVLPKSEFQLASISLFNFVPSCQVCNQKLKRARVLGSKGIPNKKLSPSSASFDFVHGAEFHVLPNPGVELGSLKLSDSPQDYNLVLDSIDPDYDVYIQLFKLQERYQQHKSIALHWLEMKYKYTNERIKMMAASLSHPRFSFSRIKSDIFQDDLYNKGEMSLSKLREDILK